MVSYPRQVERRLVLVVCLFLMADAILALLIAQGFLALSVGAGLMVLLGLAVVILSARLRAKAR